MKKRWLWSAGALYAAALCFAVMTGCAGKAPQAVQPEEIAGYSEAQVRVIASSERNRYEDVLTSEIWQAAGKSPSPSGR